MGQVGRAHEPASATAKTRIKGISVEREVAYKGEHWHRGRSLPHCERWLRLQLLAQLHKQRLLALVTARNEAPGLTS